MPLRSWNGRKIASPCINPVVMVTSGEAFSGFGWPRFFLARTRDFCDDDDNADHAYRHVGGAVRGR